MGMLRDCPWTTLQRLPQCDGCGQHLPVDAPLVSWAEATDGSGTHACASCLALDQLLLGRCRSRLFTAAQLASEPFSPNAINAWLESAMRRGMVVRVDSLSYARAESPPFVPGALRPIDPDTLGLTFAQGSPSR